MNACVFDAYALETTPGDPCSPFSPPAEWVGSSGEYLNWLRDQFKASPLVRQRLASAARGRTHGMKVTAKGPYAQEILSAVARFGQDRPMPEEIS